MCQRIFVAIDSSSTAQAALSQAIQFASLSGKSLCIGTALDLGVLVHNETALGAIIDVDAAKVTMRQAAEKLLDEAVAKAEAAGLKPYRILIESDRKRTAELIADAAARWDADLIVIGTHGRRGFQRLVMGSVAENLVRIATTSVFLVRGKHS